MTRSDFARLGLGTRRYRVTKEHETDCVTLRLTSTFPPGRERSTLTVLYRRRTVFRVTGATTPRVLVDRRGAWEKSICKEGVSCSWIA